MSERPLPIVAVVAGVLSVVLWVIAAITPTIQHQSHKLGGLNPSTPLSWAIPAWFIDPSNTTGCASDSNTCTSATCGGNGIGPCATWKQINDVRWECSGHPRGCPTLAQNTTITFLSSQTTAADPIIFFPVVNASAVEITGSIHQVASGTFSSTVSRNRSTHQLQTETLTAGLSAGELLIDTTHAGHAWLYKSAGGNAWSVSQPFAPVAIPFVLQISPPAEVDATWTNNDTFTANTLVSVNLVDFEPIITNQSAGLTQGGYIYQISVPNLSGQSFTSPVILGSNVMAAEVNFGRDVWLTGVGGVAGATLTNSIFNSYVVRTVTGEPTVDASECRTIAGGVLNAFATGVSGGYAWCWDGDVILGGGANLETSGFTNIGTIYLETGSQIQVVNGITNFEAFLYGTQIAWGTGFIQLMSGSVLGYQPGAGQATATFLQTGAGAHPFFMNGLSTGCSHTNASPDVANCGISLDVTHLDAAVGGPGFGNASAWAYEPGGARITNLGL